MKKIIVFLAIIVLLFVGIAVLNSVQNKEKVQGNPYGTNDLDQATIDQLDDPLYDNIILPEELEEKLENGEDVTAYFFSPTCPHCQRTTPIVAPLAEDMGVDLVQFNLLEFDNGWNQYRIESTPTIIHFEDGVEVGRIAGATGEEEFKEWFETYVTAEK